MDINFLVYIFVFALGACIGSFLNCAIYRMEEKKTLQGRSFCPNCKHSLNWKDLIPIFSYLYLGGKCRYCSKKISMQYLIAEIFTGIIFMLVFLKFGFLNLVLLVFMFYVSSAMIFIFIYDLKHYLIPDKILFPAIIITFIYQVFNFNNFLNCLLAGVLASGFFLALFLISKGKWMGFGDVKLAILMGFLLGTENVFVALFLAFMIGAVVGVILMTYQKKGLKSELPFAPFLITGTFAAMLYGDKIINWYFNVFKI